MADKTFVIQLLQLAIGGGVLIMMAKLLIAIGSYTARLETLERSFADTSKKVDQVYHDVSEVKGFLSAKTGVNLGGQ